MKVMFPHGVPKKFHKELLEKMVDMPIEMGKDRKIVGRVISVDVEKETAQVELILTPRVISQATSEGKILKTDVLGVSLEFHSQD